MRRFTLLLAAAVLAAVLAQTAHAAGGSYTFAGGTPRQQATVRSALSVSSFDWNVLPAPVVVQHEFAHQVDFLLFDDAKRASLNLALGGSDWCYGMPGLAHSAYGCERFASELAWAYWPSADNSMSPAATHGESAAIPVAQFRTLLAQVLGEPTLATPTAAKAFAPATKPAHAKAHAKTHAKRKSKR